MPTRRSLLASTAALATPTLAGCSTVLGGDDRHYVDVLNGDEEPHVFVVTVTNAAGGTVFDHEYDLGARRGDENRIINGTPAEVSVVVDGNDPVAFPWAPLEGVGGSPEGCTRGTSTSLSIYYEQQSGDGIKPIYGCETVRNG